MSKFLESAEKTNLFLSLARAALLLSLLFPFAAAASYGLDSSGKPSKASSKKRLANSVRHTGSYRGLVPPPPPTAVSPTVLAMYPQGLGGVRFLAVSKPKELSQRLKLTAVMDDLAFFKLDGDSETIHLKAGGSYGTITVTAVKPDQVTLLDEKGRQHIKYLQ